VNACPGFPGRDAEDSQGETRTMPASRPGASVEPRGELRIPRGCNTPDCGGVYYVAAVSDDAECPACASTRERWELSA